MIINKNFMLLLNLDREDIFVKLVFYWLLIFEIIIFVF